MLSLGAEATEFAASCTARCARGIARARDARIPAAVLVIDDGSNRVAIFRQDHDDIFPVAVMRALAIGRPEIGASVLVAVEPPVPDAHLLAVCADLVVGGSRAVPEAPGTTVLAPTHCVP